MKSPLLLHLISLCMILNFIKIETHNLYLFLFVRFLCPSLFSALLGHKYLRYVSFHKAKDMGNLEHFLHTCPKEQYYF